MKLYDLLMAAYGERLVVRNHSNESSTLAESLPGIESAIVLDASNVMRWAENTFPPPQAMRASDITRATPPFERTWCEWEGGLDRGADGGLRFEPHYKAGLLVTRQLLDDGAILRFSRMVEWYHATSAPPGCAPGWRIRNNPTASVRVDHDGNVDTNSWEPKELWSSHDHHARFTCAQFIALLAFRFAHARGVNLVQRDAPRHERRAAEKSSARTLTKFYTLEMRPISRLLETEGRLKEVGIARALHLCRGHFADYTQGAGLFGKYRVEVFVPEHIRGSKDRGTIVKDYRAVPSS